MFQEEFWADTKKAITKVYEQTDEAILSHNPDLGRGGSTAVTAILINGDKLWIANVGDSRAVLSKKGKAIQMSIDHEPNFERSSIEKKGGFVSNMPGQFSTFHDPFHIQKSYQVGRTNIKTFYNVLQAMLLESTANWQFLVLLVIRTSKHT